MKHCTSLDGPNPCSSEPAQPGDCDAEGRVRLRAEYRTWVESDQNTLGSLLAGRRPAKHLRILQPAPGSYYYLDPDLPLEDQRLVLRADSVGSISFSPEP
jgi:hypothetical protein